MSENYSAGFDSRVTPKGLDHWSKIVKGELKLLSRSGSEIDTRERDELDQVEGAHSHCRKSFSFNWSWMDIRKRRTVTIRRGRLGAGRLGAADYAPGILGAWTFRRRDF